ncbi:MAG: hypothetical protein J0I19_17005 [Alphaproteobacteria bacterium]|nr:hypothetical protein [Alphaproteobacteria bacterium]
MGAGPDRGIFGVVSGVALVLDEIVQMILQFGEIAPHMPGRDPGREQSFAQVFKRHGTAP